MLVLVLQRSSLDVRAFSSVSIKPFSRNGLNFRQQQSQHSLVLEPTLNTAVQYPSTSTNHPAVTADYLHIVAQHSDETSSAVEAVKDEEVCVDEADKAATMGLLLPSVATVLSIKSLLGTLYNVLKFVMRVIKNSSRNGANGKIAWWTDHPLFQRLCTWAFHLCAECTGDHHDQDCLLEKKSICKVRIDRTQLYAGILLVHLQLTPYMGVAACHPPSRERIDEMFEKADYDHLGTIGRKEFTEIFVLSCAHIFSRIIAYYSILLLGLPLAVKHTGLGTALKPLMTIGSHSNLIQSLYSLMGGFAERILSVAIFMIVIPMIFQHVDQFSARLLKPKKLRRRFWNYMDRKILSFDDIS